MQSQLLRLFAEGKDSDDVARILGISPQTLRNHLHHINQKLRTHNRLEAVMNAIHRKLISVEGLQRSSVAGRKNNWGRSCLDHPASVCSRRFGIGLF